MVPNSGILGAMCSRSVHRTQDQRRITAARMPPLDCMGEFINCAERALAEEGLKGLRERSGPQGFAVITGDCSYLRIHSFDHNGLILASGRALLISGASGAPEGIGRPYVRDGQGVTYLLPQDYREILICYDRAERDLLPSSAFAKIRVCLERSSQQGTTRTEVELSTGHVCRYSRDCSMREWSVSDTQRAHLGEVAGRRGMEWLQTLNSALGAS